MALWSGYTDHRDYGDEWQPAEARPAPVATRRQPAEAEHWTLRTAGGETVTLDRTRPGIATLRVDLHRHGQVAFLTTAQLRALASALTDLADALDAETAEGGA